MTTPWSPSLIEIEGIKHPEYRGRRWRYRIDGLGFSAPDRLYSLLVRLCVAHNRREGYIEPQEIFQHDASLVCKYLYCLRTLLHSEACAMRSYCEKEMAIDYTGRINPLYILHHLVDWPVFESRRGNQHVPSSFRIALADKAACLIANSMRDYPDAEIANLCARSRTWQKGQKVKSTGV